MTLDPLAEMVANSEKLASEAKRRMWAARDERGKLLRQIATVESEVVAAERDYNEARELLKQMWEQLREELRDPHPAS